MTDVVRLRVVDHEVARVVQPSSPVARVRAGTTQVVRITGVDVVGPKGDKGDTGEVGPEGEQGPQGLSGGSYKHVQGVTSTVWAIVHNLGYEPNVDLYDSGGTRMFGGIEHVSVNELTVTLASAVSGVAYLS